LKFKDFEELRIEEGKITYCNDWKLTRNKYDE
jgi:hypothetical protein